MYLIKYSDSIKGNQNPGGKSIWMKRGDKEKQFKKSFIKIGYEMRELWQFEKSRFIFYGDPQIGNIASKWLLLWTTLHMFSTQNFRFSPLSLKILLVSLWTQHMLCKIHLPMIYLDLRWRQAAPWEVMEKIWNFV